MTLRRDLVVAEGPDALAFLQGQLTADVLGGDGTTWSLLLEPNGRVLAVLLVHVSGSTATMSVERGFGEQVEERLRRFMIRTDATLRVEPASFERVLVGGGAHPSGWQHRWGSAVMVDQRVDELEVDELEADVALRVELGMPATGLEVDGQLFANALGPAAVEATCAFDKGCYVGQELVARTSSRGAVAPEVVVRLRGDGVAPATGSPLVNGDGAAVGVATTVVAEGRGWIGLGRLRRAALDLPLTCGTAEVAASALP